MARVVVQVAPNDHPTDSALDRMRFKPGDVVEIVEDGHQFSHGERNSGQYRIVDVPGVPEVRLMALKQPQFLDEASSAGEIVLRRARRLDLNLLGADSSKSELELAAVVVVKPRV